MSTKGVAASEAARVPPRTLEEWRVSELLKQYGCGPIAFVGSENAFYERHLVFDRVINPQVATARERFEAFSHSIRDVLAQRWVLTKSTYNTANAKRVYYLSLEFLIGRSLTNNITNLLLDPVIQNMVKEKGLDWPTLIEEEPDAGLGNGGLGRLAACFLDSMATMQLPAVGYGLRYEYGMFKQSFVDGWQKENPDNWIRLGDPWEVARPPEMVEVKLGCSFKLVAGNFQMIPGRPSTLFGIPFDRPVVGYGGKTINTLRLWAAVAPDYFDVQEFGAGDFVGALAETLGAESLTRVLYPDDSTTAGKGLRFIQEYFLVACSLAHIALRISDCGKRTLTDGHPAPRSGRRLYGGNEITQSERDWAFAKRALARGDDPEEVIRRIADYRADDKHDSEYYARLTVRKAQAEIKQGLASAKRATTDLTQASVVGPNPIETL